MVGFVADVKPRAVERRGRPMTNLDAFDFGHYFIRGGVNDVNVVAGAVGLNDPNFVRSR